MMKKILLLLTILATPLFASSAVFAVDVLGPDVCNRQEAAGATVCKDKELTPPQCGTPEAEGVSTCLDAGASEDDFNKQLNPITGTGGVLTSIINLLTIAVAIIAVIMIILAGLKMVTSGTNPQSVSQARERIIYAIVALVVAALAQAIVRFVVVRLSS